MVKKSEERKDISKLWEDSYLKLYKPLLGSRGELFEKAVELSKEATPQKYQEFYEEWVKTYQNNYGNFCEIHTVESSKEAFKKLLASAESSNNIYRSWIADL
jgi:hypothetical protein